MRLLFCMNVTIISMEQKERIKRIQKALNVNADGIIGDKTLTAIEGLLNLNKPIEDNMGYSVVISIGHSTADKGAVASDGHIAEYDYNKKLADIIKKELESTKSLSVHVVNRLTDGGGKGVSASVKAINMYKSDCAIELHANAYNGTASGSEVLYWHTSAKGKKLATDLQEAIIKVLNLPNRGIKPLSGEDRGGGILKGTVAPTVISEPFFIDNPKDLKLAEDKMEQLGVAIANAIIKYLYTQS